MMIKNLKNSKENALKVFKKLMVLSLCNTHCQDIKAKDFTDLCAMLSKDVNGPQYDFASAAIKKTSLYGVFFDGQRGFKIIVPDSKIIRSLEAIKTDLGADLNQEKSRTLANADIVKEYERRLKICEKVIEVLNKFIDPKNQEPTSILSRIFNPFKPRTAFTKEDSGLFDKFVRIYTCDVIEKNNNEVIVTQCVDLAKVGLTIAVVGGGVYSIYRWNSTADDTEQPTK